MSRKFTRCACLVLALAGVAAPGAWAKILIVTIGAKTGKILDTEIVDDGKPELTVQPIFVQGL